MRTDSLVELEVFFPDIEPELPRCPTPVIENRIRDAIIDACERANIWRWEHPEILVIAGQQDYDLLTPTADTLIHSILSVNVNGRPVDGCDPVNTHEDYSTRRGFSVADRGQIHLTTKPTVSSTPYRALVAPVVPAVPVDPNVNGRIIPANTSVYSYPEVRPAVRIGNPGDGSALYLLGAALSPDESIQVVDFTDYGTSGVGDSTFFNVDLRGGTADGFTPVINRLYAYIDEQRVAPDSLSSNLQSRDILAAVADGRPIMAMRYRSTGWQSMSGFVATVEDLPTLLALDGIGPSGASTDNAYASNVQDVITYSGSFGFSGGTYFSTSASVYGYWSALSIGGRVRSHLAIGTNLTTQGGGVVQVNDGGGNTREYGIYYGLVEDSGFASPAVYSTVTSNGVFIMLEQATATVRGRVLYLRGDNIGQFPEQVHQIEGILEVIEGATQQENDEYQTALVVYNVAVAALSAWNALETRTYKGIELLVSIKPSRTALHVSEVLVRDYYQLIRYGALAKGLLMLNRPWTNLEVGKEMEKQYEYALAKAKQGIDRGFATSSQRIKPRKFV